MGKTSVKCLILSTNYDHHNSTSCVDSIEKAVGIFKISAHGRHDRKHWELVDDDSMEDRLANMIKVIAENQSNKKASTTDTQQMLADNDDTAESDDKEVQEMVKKLLVLSEKADGKLEFHEEWLYFIDCGGQIQYQKLISAFIPCASVLMLVTSLAEELSSHSSTSLQFGDQKYDTSEYSLTVDTILKQLILTVNYNFHRQKALISENKALVDVIKSPEKLSIISVATHFDEYKEGSGVETIEVKEKKLAKIFEPWESNLSYKNTDAGLKIMHIVDSSQAHRAESINNQDPVISEISCKLKDQAYKVNVPIKWYAFELLLRKLAKRGCGVLSLQKCKAVGHALKLNVHDGEVESALKFFHILNTLLYYPDSSVTDLIFVLPESIFGIIDELMMYIYKAREKESFLNSSAITTMATEGIISKTVLGLTNKCKVISAKFPEFKKKLLAIFKHLLIASKLQEKEDEYFMPALLPLVDLLRICPFPGTPSCPLLFFFKEGAPAGLFCAWIVQLLSFNSNVSKMSSLCMKSIWHIYRHIDKPNYSNFIRMTRIGCNGMVAFVEHFDRFEVHCERSEDRLKVAREVESVLESTIEIRKFKGIKRGFLCCCGTQPPDHFAEVNIHYLKLVCSITHDILEIPSEYMTWIKGEFPQNP